MQELGASVEFVAATMREQAGSGVVVSSDGQQIRRRSPLQVEPGVGEDHTTVPETKVGSDHRERWGDDQADDPGERAAASP
jgi:hypothetical protein